MFENFLSYISIEGNIGVGKSFFLKELKKSLGETINNIGIIYIEEPLEDWNKNLYISKEWNKDQIDLELEYSYFDLFYKDMNKYSFDFQSYVITTKSLLFHKKIYKFTKENPNKKFIIIGERSFDVDKNVFFKINTLKGNIPQYKIPLYNSIYKSCSFSINKFHNGIIYLKTDISNIVKRIIKRDRTQEESINIDYINLLEKYHDRTFENFDKKKIIIDWDNIEVQDDDYLDYVIRNIKKFILDTIDF